MLLLCIVLLYQFYQMLFCQIKIHVSGYDFKKKYPSYVISNKILTIILNICRAQYFSECILPFLSMCLSVPSYYNFFAFVIRFLPNFTYDLLFTILWTVLNISFVRCKVAKISFLSVTLGHNKQIICHMISSKFHILYISFHQ